MTPSHSETGPLILTVAQMTPMSSQGQALWALNETDPHLQLPTLAPRVKWREDLGSMRACAVAFYIAPVSILKLTAEGSGNPLCWPPHGRCLLYERSLAFFEGHQNAIFLSRVPVGTTVSNGVWFYAHCCIEANSAQKSLSCFLQ